MHNTGGTVPTPVTALYAGLLTVLVIVLSSRVSRLRMRYRVGIGDGERPELARAIRVHANALEYVPLGILLLLLAELNEMPVPFLHLAGSALFLGRILHASGLTRSGGKTSERFVGTGITWSVIAALGVALIVGALA